MTGKQLSVIAHTDLYVQSEDFCDGLKVLEYKAQRVSSVCEAQTWSQVVCTSHHNAVGRTPGPTLHDL